MNEPQTVYFIFRGGAGCLLDVDELSFSADEVMATGLRINNCPTQVELGTTYQFDVTVIPSNTTNQIVTFYASGGTGVDYLSGEYTATSLGTQTVSVISFSDEALSDRCTFEVVERITDESTPSLVPDNDQHRSIIGEGRSARTASGKDPRIRSSDEPTNIQFYPNSRQVIGEVRFVHGYVLSDDGTRVYCWANLDCLRVAHVSAHVATSEEVDPTEVCQITNFIYSTF